MAFPTNVNDQITDSVSQVNTKVLGDAPVMAMGNLFVTVSQALSNAAHNATNNQQQSNLTMQASTTQGVSTLLSVDTASAGEATRNILGAAPPAPPSAPSEAALEQALQAARAAEEAAMHAAMEKVEQATAAAEAAAQAAMEAAAAAIASAVGTDPED